MSDCGLPDNFCVCWNLKKGGRFIAALSIGISVISCIFITIYLTSDFEKIKQELSDNHSDMAAKLSEHKTCQLLFLDANWIN